MVYRADHLHGWAGWRAPGWNVQAGVLIGDATDLLVGSHEIRIPYSLQAHKLTRYDVWVTLEQLPSPPNPRWPPDNGGDGEGFGVSVLRSGHHGYSLQSGGTDITGLTLIALPGGQLLAAKSLDGVQGSNGTYIMEVRPSHIEGLRGSLQDGHFIRLAALNARLPRLGTGYASIVVNDGTRVAIERVQIIAH